MQINDLPKSNITEAKPAVAPPSTTVPVPKPAAAAVAPKPPVAKAPEAVKDAAAATAGTKAEITDVKPTGETTAEGDPTFTLKVNGKEVQATQSEIIALAQKAKGAEAAMKKSAELEKLSADLLSNFDNDTFGLLVKRHGKDKAKEIAIAMVKNLIAEEAKDPKDIELEELRARDKENTAAKETAKKEAEEAQRKVKQTELYRKLLTDIDIELSKTVLPKDKLTLTRVLNFLSAGKKANGQVWTVADAVKAVEVEDMGHASYYAKQYVAGKLPSDQFRAIFGEEAFKKLNKEQIALLKNADKSAKHEQPNLESASETPSAKKKTLSKNRGSDGMSEREYRQKHGSLGGI